MAKNHALFINHLACQKSSIALCYRISWSFQNLTSCLGLVNYDFTQEVCFHRLFLWEGAEVIKR